MRRLDRYDVSGLVEAQVQPGSRGRVLRNLLEVSKKTEMDRLEAQALYRAMESMLGEYAATHRFTAADIRHMHRIWMGEIYEWAGEYRQVNLSKGDFPFAAAAQVPRLMAAFEREGLAANTPCAGMGTDRLASALAVVHTELILIHPFRDGNGRAARMLAVLMAAQAGLPLLDFSGVRGKARSRYFAAVQSGLDRDYAPMTGVFVAVIRRTLQTSGGGGTPASEARPAAGPGGRCGLPRSPSRTSRKGTGAGGAQPDH